MAVRRGNRQVAHMAVTNVGALPFLNTLPPRQAANVQNANNGPTGAVNNIVTRSAFNGAAPGNTTNTIQTNVNINPPPPQAATTPGTGQKVNIIA